MAEIIVGSAAVTIVPDVQRFAKELAAKIIPAADAVGRQAGERISRGIEDSVNDGLKRSASRALATAGVQGAAIGKRMADAIRRELDAIRDVRVSATVAQESLARLRAAIKSSVQDVNVGIGLSAASLAKFRADLRAAVTARDINVGINISQASLAKVAAAIRSIPAVLKVSLELDKASVLKFRAEVSAVMAAMSATVTAGIAAGGGGKSGGGGGGGGAGWAAAGAAAAGGWWGGWFRIARANIPLFGGLFGNAAVIGHINALNLALHFLVDLLIVLFPAVVTLAAGLTAFGAAGFDAAKQVASQFQNLHTVSDALDTTIKPLTGNLERMHAVVRPQVFQLLGAALNAAGKNTSIFNNLAVKTGGVLNDIAAKVDIMVSRSGPALTQFLKIGGFDLKQLSSIGQSIGSIFMTILRAGEQTQVAEKMIEAIAIAFRALATVVAAIPQPILVAGIAFFSVVHYGGVLITVLTNISKWFIKLAITDIPKAITAIRGFSLASISMGGWIAILLAIAAAIGLVIFKAQQADSNTTNWINNLNAALNNMGGGSAFLAIPNAIGQVTAKIKEMKATNAPGWISQVNKGFSNQSLSLDGVKSRWHGFLNFIGIGLNSTANDIKALTAEQQKLMTQYDNLGGAMFHAMTKGLSFSQSLGAMDAAGVKVTDSLAIMNQKIDNLIAGYDAMGQKGGAIGADLNALTVVATDQVTAMGKLNDAWDKFIGFVTAPPTTFLAWDSAITTFAQDAKAAGASMQGLGGGPAVKFNAPKVSSASVALQNQFETVINQAQTFFDSMRNSNALGGGASFTRTVQDMVASLLPLTGGSKAALAQVSALAQEAGGPATMNMKELAKWSGNQGAAKATNDLYRQQQLAVMTTYNLNLDAQKLTATLQQDLVPSMANAILKSSGAKSAIQNFADAAVKAHSDITKLYKPGQGLLDSLMRAGISKSSAKAMITGMLQEMKFTPKQIAQFWSGIAKGPKKPTQLLVKPSAVASPSKIINSLFGTGPKPPAKGFPVTFASVISDQGVQHFFMVLIPSWTGQAQKNMANWARNSWQAFDNEVVHPIQRFFTQQLVHFIGVAGNWISNWAVTGWRHFHSAFVSPLSNWFTKTLPHFFTTAGQWISNWASTGWRHFYSSFISPIAKWFTNSLPHFFTVAAQWIANWAVTGWNHFVSSFINPLSNWFTGSLPHFFTTAAQWIANWAITGWNHFYSSFVSPMANFWTSTVPGFFNGLGNMIGNVASNLWNIFYNGFLGPIVKFFENLPATIGNALSHISIKSLIPGPLQTVLHTLHVPGFAGGTRSAPPGWAWVGERGPELAYFRGGESVMSNPASRMFAQQHDRFDALAHKIDASSASYHRSVAARATHVMTTSGSARARSAVPTDAGSGGTSPDGIALLARIAKATEAAPARTGTAVAKSLQGVSGSAAARRIYSTGSGY